MRRHIFRAALLGTALLAGGQGHALAQTNPEDRAIRDLPRPGYEPRQIRMGHFTLSPELLAGAEYISNVFATSSNPDADMLFTLSPSMGIRRDDGRFTLNASMFGTLREYVDNPREGVNTFGATGRASYAIGKAHLVTAGLGAERSFERRTDPESPNDLGLPPAKIDILRSELGYQYRPGRFGFGLRGAIDRYNYLPAADADRDLTSVQGSARVTARISHRFDAFTEVYINRRDARTHVDRNGVDRDMTTKGVLVGLASDLSERLKGEIGVGLFRANPDDPTLKSFTGFAASGNLTWRPRIRTAITASLFRGNVATTRSGASGRIDSTASLRLDQEARHNLILSAAIGIRDTRYRGGLNRRQTLASAQLEATYLVNRRIALIATTTFAKRTADQPLDRFEAFRFGLATRITY